MSGAVEGGIRSFLEPTEISLKSLWKCPECNSKHQIPEMVDHKIGCPLHSDD